MKSKKQIKDELHKLIDSIEDEDILSMLNEDVVPYVIENKTMPHENEEELNEEQQHRLEEAIKQADEGKVIPLEEFYSKINQWRTK